MCSEKRGYPVKQIERALQSDLSEGSAERALLKLFVDDHVERDNKAVSIAALSPEVLKMGSWSALHIQEYDQADEEQLKQFLDLRERQFPGVEDRMRELAGEVGSLMQDASEQPGMSGMQHVVALAKAGFEPAELISAAYAKFMLCEGIVPGLADKAGMACLGWPEMATVALDLAFQHTQVVDGQEALQFFAWLPALNAAFRGHEAFMGQWERLCQMIETEALVA